MLRYLFRVALPNLLTFNDPAGVVFLRSRVVMMALLVRLGVTALLGALVGAAVLIGLLATTLGESNLVDLNSFVGTWQSEPSCKSRDSSVTIMRIAVAGGVLSGTLSSDETVDDSCGAVIGRTDGTITKFSLEGQTLRLAVQNPAPYGLVSMQLHFSDGSLVGVTNAAVVDVASGGNVVGETSVRQVYHLLSR